MATSAAGGVGFGAGKFVLRHAIIVRLILIFVCRCRGWQWHHQCNLLIFFGHGLLRVICRMYLEHIGSVSWSVIYREFTLTLRFLRERVELMQILAVPRSHYEIFRDVPRSFVRQDCFPMQAYHKHDYSIRRNA